MFWLSPVACTLKDWPLALVNVRWPPTVLPPAVLLMVRPAADYDYEDEEEDEKKNMSREYWEARYQTGEMSWEKGAPSPGLVDFLAARPGLPRGTVCVPG